MGLLKEDFQVINRATLERRRVRPDDFENSLSAAPSQESLAFSFNRSRRSSSLGSESEFEYGSSGDSFQSRDILEYGGGWTIGAIIGLNM